MGRYERTPDGWTVYIEGDVYEYQQQFTLTGAAQNLDVIIPFPFQLNKIEYFSDDATAKSFTERIYSGNVDTSSYGQIVSVTADTNQPLSYAGDISDKWTQQPIRIRTAVSASTLNKKLTKKINVTRLM